MPGYESLLLDFFRIRLAAGFTDPESGANFFFWFMHSITLTLHGNCNVIVDAFVASSRLPSAFQCCTHATHKPGVHGLGTRLMLLVTVV